MSTANEMIICKSKKCRIKIYCKRHINDKPGNEKLTLVNYYKKGERCDYYICAINN